MDFSLALTHDCNLACRYCYAGAKRRDVMSRDTARAAIDFAFAFGAKEMQLGFFGGEPLLEWDLLTHCTEQCEARAEARQCVLKKTVTTNGSLLTAERVDWLHWHGFYPAISLDGLRAMHDLARPFADGRPSYDACRRGLKLARARFPGVEVIIVPDPVTIAGLAAGVRQLADEEGVARVSLNPNFYTKWDEAALELWRQAYEEIADFYLARHRAGRPVAINVLDAKVITRLKDGYAPCDTCNFGEREIAVAPSGRLYPCERLIGEDWDLAMCIGDVSRGGFDEPKRKAVLARRGNVNPECRDCGLRGRCMNWCCCINYTLTGAIDRTDGVVCHHERIAIAAADRVAAILYNERNPAFLSRFYQTFA